MPAKDVDGIYLLLGEVKGKVDALAIQVSEMRQNYEQRSSAINVTISAQSSATVTLGSKIDTAIAKLDGLDNRLAAAEVLGSDYRENRDLGRGAWMGAKLIWAGGVLILSSAAGVVGWLLGLKHAGP